MMFKIKNIYSVLKIKCHLCLHGKSLAKRFLRQFATERAWFREKRGERGSNLNKISRWEILCPQKSYSPNFIKKNKKRYFIFNLLYFFIALFFCFAVARDAFAFEKFGGRVLFKAKCDSPGELIKIGPPSGGTFFYGPGSITYLFGRPRIGVWTLGLTLGIAPCKKGKVVIWKKRIIMIGTSMY